MPCSWRSRPSLITLSSVLGHPLKKYLRQTSLMTMSRQILTIVSPTTRAQLAVPVAIWPAINEAVASAVVTDAQQRNRGALSLRLSKCRTTRSPISFATVRLALAALFES